MNFYNEHDPNAAAWLRELIARGLIPAGVVDERSIAEIQPHELNGYTQCHFFAGIGGWSLALSLAGWPDTEPVWTGSCPCQPFSVAGKGLGSDDERHLWPVFCRLIAECRPQCVFGEQVANAIGKGWLDGVSADLEAHGYACGSAVLGAHSVGAPHQRQRLFWVADSELSGSQRRIRGGADQEREDQHGYAGCGGPACSVADATSGRFGVVGDAPLAGCGGYVDGGFAAGRVGDAGCGRDERRREVGDMGCEAGKEQSQARERKWSWDADCDTGANGSGLVLADSRGLGAGHASAAPARHWDSVEPASFWSGSRLIPCRDGKLRRIPVEPALFPLVDGVSYKLARRGSIRPALLKGAGNAIVPQVAAEFISAFTECRENQLTPA